MIPVLEKSHFENFLTAVENSLPPGGKAEFEPYCDEELELSHLAADTPGHGWGTQAMKIITQHADQFQVNLMVLPAGANRQDSEPLAEFYRRFGFEGEDALHRTPRK